MDPEPTNFHQGNSNPHVSCSSSPFLNTPYIYINIHRGKKEYSIISCRLMNLSRSRPAFFLFFFFQALSELPEEACLPKEPRPTQNLPDLMLCSRSVHVVKDLATRGGKQTLFLSVFPLQTEENGSDLLCRPRGLADMEALARSLPCSQVMWSCKWQELMAKAGSVVFSLNHILHVLFSFPHGCS